ncbi:hypothetical protein N7468_008527 [Penicillium chermesinum]|uniref:RING-type domain-containing protein n=1 Tax=Penicillium chermesinum TaxID=63820 RepID=A0A9W9TJY7_9EURO|nr:uncharacterized protein N7468_008527 [Penicillium chermesinum]KAJ5223985.1 hypothetical protein N7468_008527 [Penicillium chermesinum]
MAAADPPAGLMVIASLLPQEEIPMKLRCAICNLLATNAFRLPCCDQSICETCQNSLSDTCPVCAHSPVSPDLCRPNKALRITLKAYLRTEEKKREKERQAAAPPTPTTTNPPAKTESQGCEENQAKNETVPDVPESSGVAAAEGPNGKADTVEASPSTEPAESAANVNHPEPANPSNEVSHFSSRVRSTSAHTKQSTQQPDDAPTDATNPPSPADAQVDPAVKNGIAAQDAPLLPGQISNLAGGGQGGFSGIPWNSNGNFGAMNRMNGMNPFMASSMYNFPNQMGMSMMNMDPRAANQGMFGDYGMNMTGMGMNMGMNFNGQNMYGTLGWDGSQQNMWQGGENKFNPNAFANGTGPPYEDHLAGPICLTILTRITSLVTTGRAIAEVDSEVVGEASIIKVAAMEKTESEVEVNPADGEPLSGESNLVNGDSQQLQGIPTIDSLDESSTAMPNGYPNYSNHPNVGYGRGGYMRGHMAHRGGGSMSGSTHPHVELRNPGVEGAPAAPRAMREGRPNTSLLRQRGFHNHTRTLSGSKASGVPARMTATTPKPRKNHRQRPLKNTRKPRILDLDLLRRLKIELHNVAHLQSMAPMMTGKAAMEVAQGIEIVTLGLHRRALHITLRDVTVTRIEIAEPATNLTVHDVTAAEMAAATPTETGIPKDQTGLTLVASPDESAVTTAQPETDPVGGRMTSPVTGFVIVTVVTETETETATETEIVSVSGTGTGTVAIETGNQTQTADATGNTTELTIEAVNPGGSERKNASDVVTVPKQRNGYDDRSHDRDSTKAAAEKDPNTLEREARDRERMLREKQRREKANSGSRRDSRPDRVVAGRRINFKYEDEL